MEIEKTAANGEEEVGNKEEGEEEGECGGMEIEESPSKRKPMNSLDSFVKSSQKHDSSYFSSAGSSSENHSSKHSI